MCIIECALFESGPLAGIDVNFCNGTRRESWCGKSQVQETSSKVAWPSRRPAAKKRLAPPAAPAPQFRIRAARARASPPAPPPPPLPLSCASLDILVLPRLTSSRPLTSYMSLLLPFPSPPSDIPYSYLALPATRRFALSRHTSPHPRALLRRLPL